MTVANMNSLTIKRYDFQEFHDFTEIIPGLM